MRLGVPRGLSWAKSCLTDPTALLTHCPKARHFKVSRFCYMLMKYSCDRRAAVGWRSRGRAPRCCMARRRLLGIHEVGGAAERGRAGIDPDLLPPAAKNGRRRRLRQRRGSATVAEPDGAEPGAAVFCVRGAAVFSAVLWLAEGGHSRPSSGPWGVRHGGWSGPAVAPQAQDKLYGSIGGAL